MGITVKLKIQCYGWHYSAQIHPDEVTDVPSTFDPAGHGWHLVDNDDFAFHPILRKVWLCPACYERLMSEQ